MVFGAGNPTADLSVRGRGARVSRGPAGDPVRRCGRKLLEKLLAGIGLERSDVYIANVLRWPSGNPDLQPDEIESCEPHLFRQIEINQPKLVATLELRHEIRSPANRRGSACTARRGRRSAAQGAPLPALPPCGRALTPAMLKILEEDFARVPQLLDWSRS